MTNNNIFYKQYLFWIIILLWLIIGYYISPAPSIVAIILAPGNIITGLWISPLIGLNFNVANFTTVHQFLYIAHFINLIYYILLYIIISFIKRKISR